MGSVAITVISGYKRETYREQRVERELKNCTNPVLNTHESRAYITKYRTVTIEQ